MSSTDVRTPKRWSIVPAWQGCEQVARRFGISRLIAQLLFNRGIISADTPPDQDAIRAFLKPEIKTLPDPDLLPGANRAAEIVVRKIRERRPIVIYGDYDVDGLTGVAILWHLLRLAGTDVRYYIPHRIEEGYGLKSEALRHLRDGGADTLITVDCGITAVEQARLARELGLTLIITDHHAPGATLPEADVLVHPCIAEGYPNPYLCGAGVAFKLAWAIARNLSGSLRVRPEFREFLKDATSLAALGTIADVVPLVGENRVLARFGLAGLADSRLAGVRALIEAARLEGQKLDSEHVGFWLAPRLNAAGRMGHAQLAAELLTEADESRGREIALYLEEQNHRRQSLEKRIFQEACERIEADRLASDARRAIVLAGPDWHAGVIGIVAARVVEEYGRPAVLISLTNGEGQGSARSVAHFPLHEALGACGEHLLVWGGHAMAAGLRIACDRVEAFTEAFVARANQTLTARDLEPVSRLDAEVGLAELTEAMIRDLQRLGPFGQQNPKPRFASPTLMLDGEPRTVGRNGEHLSFCLTDGHTRRRAIAFGLREHLDGLRQHRRCRVAYRPTLNTFNGRTSVELHVLDLALPED
ncbi:MAG TPA: single-stranded-DNA-specific exonuclease RecJ [Phycisphaerae bacterium]|nr:single-stranded-DNA-specific exonuclease RecJ [Phycisphaerae bacterium]